MKKSVVARVLSQHFFCAFIYFLGGRYVSEQYIKNMRILHFEKYLSCENEDKTGTKKKAQKPRPRVCRQFFSFGYYDELSYVRAMEPDIFDYKHCFLLKYPYTASGRQMVADQIITLNDSEDSIAPMDPFEYAREGVCPFLGILLVTASGVSGNSVCAEDMYGSLIDILKNICDTFLSDCKGARVCYKYFYTPNCADLCIAVRTDTLELIYRLKQRIASQNVTVNGSGGMFHAISHTLVELTKGFWTEQILKNNEAIQIEMRISASGGVMEKIKSYLESAEGKRKGNIYGITGAGQYALEVDFETFAKLYPLLQNMKTDPFKSAETVDPDRLGDLDDLQKCFKDGEIECSYMRVKYPMYVEEDLSMLPVRGWPDEALITKYRTRVFDLKKQIPPVSVSLYSMIGEKEVMLRELFNTYNDFWYQPCSWWKGLWFYVQLESILNGIDRQIGLIEKCILDEEQKQRSDAKQIQTRVLEERLVIQLCKDITRAVAAVNNFNKLLQSNNQYVINVPNYEIQTKVNVEKYLMAYTMHLLKICIHYKKQMEPKKMVVPIIALNLSADGIYANMLFCEHGNCTVDAGEESVEGVPFAISVPNYQWLANAYHILPMITHEISHNYRYMDRKIRNRFAWEYNLCYLSNYLLEQIMEPVTEHGELFYGSIREFLREGIEKTVLEESRRLGMNPQIRDRLKFCDVGLHIRDDFFGITGIGTETERRRNHQCWELVTDEMTAVADIAAVDYIQPQDLAELPIKEENCSLILFNAVLDILAGEKRGKGMAVCRAWQSALSEEQQHYPEGSAIGDVLSYSLEEVNHYNYFGEITEVAVSTAVRAAIIVWTKKETVARQCHKDAVFKNAVDSLLAMRKNIFSVSFTPDKKDSPGQVWEQARCYEELGELQECVENILTNVLKGSNGKIVYKKSRAEEFAGLLHEKLHENYMTYLDKENRGRKLWITFKNEQSRLVSLGIINPDKKQFVEHYKNVVSRIAAENVEKIIKEQNVIYDEIFADMGMCEAFRFSAYGYFMYSIHIFMKQRNIPFNEINNFTHDRIKILLTALFPDEIGMNGEGVCIISKSKFGEKLNRYWGDLKGILEENSHVKCCIFFKPLLDCKSFFDIDTEDIEAVFKNMRKAPVLSGGEMTHLEILRWMVALYERLDFENRIKDENRERLIRHIRISKENMKSNGQRCGYDKSWFEMCSEDAAVQDIGRYYNQYCYSEVIESHAQGRCLKYQNQFVEQNYSQMFNFMHKVRWMVQNESNSEKNLLDILFDYNWEEGGSDQ